jgi:hypothetical protein
MEEIMMKTININTIIFACLVREVVKSVERRFGLSSVSNRFPLLACLESKEGICFQRKDFPFQLI